MSLQAAFVPWRMATSRPAAEQGNDSMASNILDFKESAEKPDSDETVATGNPFISKPLDVRKKSLGEILSISKRTFCGLFLRLEKDSGKARDKRIFDMWIACHTQEEIAQALGISQPQVQKIIGHGSDKSSASQSPEHK